GWLDLDLDARGEPHLAVGHDTLVGREALRDHDMASLLAPDGDGPRLDGGVGLDDEDVRALLPGLDRFGRNHEGARIVGQRENDIDEAAGPEGARGVREGRLETDRAGCPVDRVVDERKL